MESKFEDDYFIYTLYAEVKSFSDKKQDFSDEQNNFSIYKRDCSLVRRRKKNNLDYTTSSDTNLSKENTYSCDEHIYVPYSKDNISFRNDLIKQIKQNLYLFVL